MKLKKKAKRYIILDNAELFTLSCILSKARGVHLSSNVLSLDESKFAIKLDNLICIEVK